MSSPSVSDHFRPVDADHPDGIYRVVGTDDDSVTLLRVADADLRRRPTGEVITVETAALDAFDSAETPDGNGGPGRAATDSLGTLYWQIRAFARELALAPLATVAVLLAILAGVQGAVPLPSDVKGGLILVGSLGVAILGSGLYRRLR